MKKALIIVLFALFFCKVLFSSVRSNLSSGNSAFKKEKYDIALEKYKNAEASKPGLPEAVFNIGNVYYKTGDYEDALKSFEKATYSKDIELQCKAYYNMGNSLFRMGKLPEAILFYKKAIELNSADEDAKFNLEFVQKKIKENMDKNKKQQSQQHDEKDKKEKQKKQDGQKNQQDENKEKGEEKKQGMSKEDAQRLLNSLGDEKKPKEKAKMKVPIFRMPEKDW